MMYGCRFCHKNKMGAVVDFSQHTSSLALSSSSGSYSLKNTSRLLKKIRRNKFSTLSSPVRSIVQVNQAQQCFAPIISCKIEPDPDEENEQVANNNIGVQAALSTLRFYKREISPLLPKSCRYVPTCSEYSMIAYNKYGFVKGTLLTACRICRCNPLGGSGFDPPRWFDEKRVSQEEEDL